MYALRRNTTNRLLLLTTANPKKPTNTTHFVRYEKINEFIHLSKDNFGKLIKLIEKFGNIIKISDIFWQKINDFCRTDDVYFSQDTHIRQMYQCTSHIYQ